MNKPAAILSTPLAVLLGALMISFSILLSGGIIKIGKPPTNIAGIQSAATPAPAAPVPSTVKVSIDDDPILGDKDAPLTIIEFSDYECPFCKRHFDQTYPTLKKNYIDPGKVKLVYRDLPLPFHDPMATIEAQAANCSREQGGDSVYFKYHDEIFTRTKSNGNGLAKDNLYTIAADLGLNSTGLKSCVEAEKYTEEIKKDLSDASSAGANGTPTFFIGKSTLDGVIDGKIIVGAQPFSVFQSTIDGLLK